MTVNVLVMLHGITVEPEPRDHRAAYDALWAALRRRQPRLSAALVTPLGLEWGHEPPGSPNELRPDQLLTRAENFINEQTSYASLKTDPSPYNHMLTPKDDLGELRVGALASRWLLRPYLLTPFKEKVMVRGFTDVLYYCSPDGETAIRRAVYSQFLNGLAPYRNAAQVRLHVVAQSLGVTVAFDFLFGLFAPDSHFPGGVPGFVREHRDDVVLQPFLEAYTFWRERRAAGGLVLGSVSSTGGQLPLMMMRKQTLVERLARGERLDASVIGVAPGDALKWKLFYDADDALGFPARRVFEPQAAIQEYEVDTHWRPDLAHSLYWKNEVVQREIADLIAQNL